MKGCFTRIRSISDKPELLSHVGTVRNTTSISVKETNPDADLEMDYTMASRNGRVDTRPFLFLLTGYCYPATVIPSPLSAARFGGRATRSDGAARNATKLQMCF